MIVRIGYVLYPITTLGPGVRLGIWFKGCSRHCDGCIAPELQVHAGPCIEVSSLLRIISNFINTHPVEGVTISGGEPFEQPEALAAIAENLSMVIDDILIYSGYTYEALKMTTPDTLHRIERASSALITGPYMADEDDGRSPLWGSSNQVLHICKPELITLYHEYIHKSARRSETFICEDKVVVVGIPS